jgi:hypothetical protein
MSDGPLGIGTVGHPAAGNALLVTRDQGGTRVETFLWVDDVRTDLDLELEGAQTKGGNVHFPIRVAGRVLTFSALFPLMKEGFYFRLMKLVRDHWVHDLNASRVTPMEFHYYGANKVYLGLIAEEQVGRAWNDVILRPNFTFNLITNQVPSATISGKAPYIPYRGDVSDWGPMWYTASELFDIFNPGKARVGGGSSIEGGEGTPGPAGRYASKLRYL